MAITRDQVVVGLKGLLPTGKVWSLIKNTTYHYFIVGVAEVFYQVMLRKHLIMKEIDPRYSVALIDKWEKELGLPDVGLKEPETLKERQAIAYQRLTAKGGQSPAFFKQLVASLGFTAEVIEHKYFRVGSRVGSRLTNSTEWLFTWRLKLSEGAVFKFRVGSRVGDRLRVVRNDLVEHMVNKYKPAHTKVLFVYGD